MRNGLFATADFHVRRKCLASFPFELIANFNDQIEIDDTVLRTFASHRANLAINKFMTRLGPTFQFQVLGDRIKLLLNL